LALPPDADKVRALLLDIEGTTTPIDFVSKTLFPFASKHVEDFLRRRSQETEIETLLAQLREESDRDAADGAPIWTAAAGEEKISSAAAYVAWLILRDSKISVLKTLQGKIWEEGFLTGRLKGELYPDVASAFARWKTQERRIAIFSSGSVLAQKLLFAHSTSGDLSSFLDAYFDTTTGPKRDAESYRKIAASMELEPRAILFVSDVGEELEAARAAGMNAAHSLRAGIPALQDERHLAIRDFGEIFPGDG
jgi:enolase-phosphatase E1